MASLVLKLLERAYMGNLSKKSILQKAYWW